MNISSNVVPGPGFRNELGMAAQLQKHLPYKNPHLLEYRLKTGYISQAVAGERAGVTTQTWMDIENNKVIPTEEQALQICTILGKELKEVFPKGVRILWPSRIKIIRYSKLVLLRASHNITQAELANKVLYGFPKAPYTTNRIMTVISDLEWNLAIDPSNMEIVKRIAKILWVTPQDIL